MKKYKMNIIILVSISIFIMYLIMKDNFDEISQNILHANLLYILLGLLLVVVHILFQSLSMHLYLKEIDSNYRFKNTFILMFSALFFNAITPFSSGGQPFQVYILNKQGIKVTESTNAILQNFLAYQISLILLGTTAIIINNNINIIPSSNVLKNIVLAGFIINVAVLLFIIFLGKAKNINTKLFNKIFNFIFNLKVFRNKPGLKEKANKKIDEFYESNKYFKNNKFILLKSVLLNMCALLILYSVPLLIFYSVGNNSINLLETIVCSSYTYFIESFVPIPGGTGGLEYGFIEFFKKFSTPAILSSCMILWRFTTYYLTMILGALSLLFVKKKVN